MEIAYVGGTFPNFKSADLAEIAHGNRMWKSRKEIAYVGASFANLDSADLAEIFYENRIWNSHMSAQVSQISIRRIMRKCEQNAREREQLRFSAYCAMESCAMYRSIVVVVMRCIGSLIQNLILPQIDFARWPWAWRVSWSLTNILSLNQSTWMRRKQSKVLTVARGGAWSCTDCTVRLRRWGTCGAGRPAACGTTSTRTLRSPRRIAGHTANS